MQQLSTRRQFLSVVGSLNDNPVAGVGQSMQGAIAWDLVVAEA